MFAKEFIKVLAQYPEDTVFVDLFGGSGTAMIACEQIDRTCLMMEYDSHYADVILDRWEKFTGGHAERADD